MAEKDLSIKISVNDQASKEIKKIGQNLSGFAERNSDNFKKMAGFWTAALAGIVAGAKMAVDAFAESEAQLARVDQTLKNIDLTKMGSSFDEAAAKSREFGASLQALSGIGDEAGAESFAKLLQVTKDYEMAQKAATLAADLSVAKQIDIASATKAVSMALAGNTRILKEYGVEVEDGASKQEVLGLMMEKVWGQAEAFGKTTAGQTAIINQSFGDVMESIGQALVPAFNEVQKALIPILQSVGKWISDNAELVATIAKVAAVVAVIVTALGGLGLAIIPVIAAVNGMITAFTFAVGAIKAVSAAMAFLAANPIALVIAALAALALAMYYVWKNWDEIRPKLEAFWASIKQSFTGAANYVRDMVTGAFESMLARVTAITDYIAQKAQAALNFANSVRNALKEAGGNAFDAVSGAVSNFGGARAEGGPVTKGKTYLVGENGPELFTAAQSGSITPNGGGGVTLNVNMGGITVANRQDADYLVARIKSELTREIRLARIWIA